MIGHLVWAKILPVAKFSNELFCAASALVLGYHPMPRWRRVRRGGVGQGLARPGTERQAWDGAVGVERRGLAGGDRQGAARHGEARPGTER